MIKTVFSQKTITSEKLILQPLSLEDGFFIYKLLNSDGWKKFIGDRNINSIEDAKNYIQKIQNLPETIYWVAHQKENNTPVGVITLMKRANFDFYDLGFAFLPEFSGRGYAFEASNVVLKAIKNETSLENVSAITLPENSKSIELLERLKMTFEKEIIENNETLFLYQLDLKKL